LNNRKFNKKKQIQCGSSTLRMIQAYLFLISISDNEKDKNILRECLQNFKDRLGIEDKKRI